MLLSFHDGRFTDQALHLTPGCPPAGTIRTLQHDADLHRTSGRVLARPYKVGRTGIGRGDRPPAGRPRSGRPHVFEQRQFFEKEIRGEGGKNRPAAPRPPRTWPRPEPRTGRRTGTGNPRRGEGGKPPPAERSGADHGQAACRRRPPPAGGRCHAATAAPKPPGGTPDLSVFFRGSGGPPPGCGGRPWESH